MAAGASLHLMFLQHKSFWTLSDGTVVAPEIAMAVVNDVRVVSVGDGLFPATSQTWRFVES
jgi:hypothetical protein